MTVHGQLARVSEARQSADWTGLKHRKRLIHLSGQLNKTTIDVRYVESPDYNYKPNIYGHYDVTIWQP